MRFTEAGLLLRGAVKLTAYEGDVERDDEGRILNPVVFEAIRRNLIVTVGKNMSMDRLYGLSAVGALSNTGVGTSATAAAAGDTTLTGGVWQAYDSTPTRSAQTVTSVTTYGTGAANINIQEAALSNGSPATSAGTLLNRLAPIGPFNKTAAVSLSVTVAVTQA